MKAICVHQFGDPDVLKLKDVADPRPLPRQVVVRVKAIGVNPVETYVRAGNYGPRQFPYTPGSDAAGVIEAVGHDVTEFKAGDRVYTDSMAGGAYAQLLCCDARRVHRLPARATFAQGAAMGVPYGTAHYALFHRGRARAGESVLIHGASGGVGTAAIQLARSAGLTVIGTGGTDKGRQLVRKQGAHHVFDHTSADYFEKILELTGGKGVPLIIEMLANVNLGKDLTILSKLGRVVVVGSRGKVEIDPRNTMGRDADILGMSLLNATDDQLAAMHAGLVAGLEDGTLIPVIGREFPLAQADRAHEQIMQAGAYGKIVLVP